MNDCCSNSCASFDGASPAYRRVLWIIIALNENPRAAIFKAADYGIVGDWQTYLPPLVDALQPVLAAIT